jgi:hypothetical protein
MTSLHHFIRQRRIELGAIDDSAIDHTVHQQLPKL